MDPVTEILQWSLMCYGLASDIANEGNVKETQTAEFREYMRRAASQAKESSSCRCVGIALDSFFHARLAYEMAGGTFDEKQSG